MSSIFLDKKIKDNIKQKFYKVKDLEEFATLLNFVERQFFKNFKAEKLIDVDYLYYLSKTKSSRYTQFEIPKKNGSVRVINSPDTTLKRIQKLINIILQIIFEDYSHYNSNGFILGKDIRRNAIPHINKNYVLNIDIKNFFPSINFRRIKVVLELSPFKLNNNREKISFLIANLATTDGTLPQGSPISPIISNIVTQKLDRKLSKFCLKSKIKYSRYADDLTFSSNKKVFNSEFIEKIEGILNQENFLINNQKTRIKSSMERQEVTGLVVNKKLNIKREFLQKTRAMLNNWEKGGLNYAKKEFKKHQPESKKNYEFKDVLLGQISFIRLVKGIESPIVNKISLKFNYLNNLIDYTFISNENVKKKLINDNIKMEKLLFDKNESEEDIFIPFCTSAFHQIENLLNYYYWRKFPVFLDLLKTLLENNPNFKRRYRNLKNANNHFKKISDLNINVLVYLYEKEFFFDKNRYYDKRITHLREVRNDDSHRCQIIDIDKDSLKKDYELLQDKIKIQDKKGKQFDYKKEDKKLIRSYETLKFIEKKDFKKVRNSLRIMSYQIKNTLPNNVHKK
ncbi:reverse transcriptase domain-containing protein [Lutibacter sp. B1]|uniref:reverse transcriptase domain-containing protein n=1 Tax=Lutibacter sp. B1 TaxID=2725996 RepID=UPI00145728E4|nr:reverse transcriptase domain-containing protein [Lutibacter sp. B1]NLP59384.1 RNA-directed DNA polymerase [Lutibacter sp. B1]